MAEHLTIPGALEWDAVERHSIATLRYAGGKEHDVKYVSEVAYDALKKRLSELKEALEGMVEYFPEGHSDGECFSVERANLVLGRPTYCVHDWFPDYCLKCGIPKP